GRRRRCHRRRKPPAGRGGEGCGVHLFGGPRGNDSRTIVPPGTATPFSRVHHLGRGQHQRKIGPLVRGISKAGSDIHRRTPDGRLPPFRCGGRPFLAV